MLTLARDGYRSRVSDVLNASERDFITLTDVTVAPLDGGPIELHAYLSLARRHIVVRGRRRRHAVAARGHARPAARRRGRASGREAGGAVDRAGRRRGVRHGDRPRNRARRHRHLELLCGGRLDAAATPPKLDLRAGVEAHALDRHSGAGRAGLGRQLDDRQRGRELVLARRRRSRPPSRRSSPRSRRWALSLRSASRTAR